jgi:capsular polysaccharide transport system permease protein
VNALQPLVGHALELRSRVATLPYRTDRLGQIARVVYAELATRPFRLFISVVTTIAVFYFGILATPLYVSQSQFAIKSKSPVSTVPLMAALTGQTQTGLTEITAISKYIQSSQILAVLDRDLHLRAAYTRPRLDFMNYLSPYASNLDFLRFYTTMVSVDIDTDTNIVTLQAKSYDAASARKLATAILIQSSEFINRMSDQMRRESIRSAQIDFEAAQKDDLKAREAMAKFRTTVGNLDPSAVGMAAGQSIVSMRADIDRLRTQIASLRTYSTDNSPQVRQLLAQITYLEQRIKDTQTKMVSGNDQDSLNQQLTQYTDLTMKQDYADKRLVTAQAALDEAKSVAEQKTLFVVSITNPTLPDRPTSPQRLWSIFSIIAISATLYGIAQLALAGLRDHQGG